MLQAALENILQMALLSAPWLLLGLVAAGLIRAWVPMNLVGRSLGGSGFRHVFRAALIGAPLPLCSCGTLPAAMSLHRSGASRAATTSFLIATPETGVDSVALSWVLLGPFLAIFRPLAAIVSAITAGLLVGRSERPISPAPVLAVEMAPDACASDPKQGCCCDTTATAPSAGNGFWHRTFDGLGYAFSDLLDDLTLWLLIGIVAAGLVVTLAPPDLLAGWGSGLPAMLLVLLISVPMYVCATASTPLAAAMLLAGVSPGTVLVFLLAGPASNLASLALVRRELGQRALVAYLTGVAGVALLLGIGLDAVVNGYGIDVLAGMARPGAGEEDLPTLVNTLSLLLLVALAIRPFRRYLLGGKAADDGGCCG